MPTSSADGAVIRFRQSQRHNNMLGIIAAVAQVYYFLHESAVCRFRATVVFSVYHGEKLCFRQYEMVHYLFCFEGLHLFISVRTLIYGANHSPKHEKRL